MAWYRKVAVKMERNRSFDTFVIKIEASGLGNKFSVGRRRFLIYIPT